MISVFISLLCLPQKWMRSKSPVRKSIDLSAGVTPRLSLPARIMIIIFMYFGRVGVLTLSVGFLKKKPAGEKYMYAHTDLLIG